MEDKSIYIKIESSNSIRRDVLEGAANDLILLKQIEESLDLFEHEEVLYKKFINKINNIKLSITKLGNSLPHIGEEEVPQKEIKKKIIVKQTRPKTESDILKDQIDDIERKLKSL